MLEMIASCVAYTALVFVDAQKGDNKPPLTFMSL